MRGSQGAASLAARYGKQIGEFTNNFGADFVFDFGVAAPSSSALGKFELKSCAQFVA